jgi:hypothetical protein
MTRPPGKAKGRAPRTAPQKPSAEEGRKRIGAVPGDYFARVPVKAGEALASGRMPSGAWGFTVLPDLPRPASPPNGTRAAPALLRRRG